MDMSARPVTASAVSLCLFGLPTPSHAARTGTTPQADHIRLGEAAPGPFAFTHFCLRYTAEREGSRPARNAAFAVTPWRHAELLEVNAAVNRTIAPLSRAGDTSYDTWRIGPRRGDCNDYAVTKRHALLARGWPSDSLLLSEVVTPWGEHHLVLVVRTPAQDLVLDNLTPQVRPWRQTPYRWVRVQMPDDPALWSRVDGGGRQKS